MTTDDIFKPESKTLKQIFGDVKGFYQMPDYQRPYSWEDEQVEQLWEDIFIAFQNHSEDPELDPTYFLGSVILIPRDNSFDVVDGQQRLTTLSILFCVIRDLYPNLNEDLDIDANPNAITIYDIKDCISYQGRRNRLKLRTHLSNQNEFEQTIIKGITWPVKLSKKDKKEKKYLNTAILFRDKIMQLKLEELNSFIEYLFNKVRLITITCSGQSFAIKLFQVLNTRGMDLSPADLIKSLLLSKLHDDKQQQFMATWKEIESLVKETDSDLTDIFTYYQYYLLSANPKRGLYDELAILFKDEDANKIIFDVKKFIESYRKVYFAKDRAIYSMHYLRHQLYWKSILTTAAHLNFDEFDNLVIYLRKLYYLYWIGGFTSAKIKQISYNIITWLKQKQTFPFIKNEIDKKLTEDSVVDRFKRNLSEDIYGEAWVKPLLILVEYNQVDSSNLMNFITIDKSVQIEHILPQQSRKIGYWKAVIDDVDAAERINKLENLTLISGTKNIQASNRPYSFENHFSPTEEKMKYFDASLNKYVDKLFIYEGKGIDGITGFRTTQLVRELYKNWDNSDMNNRKKWMINEIGKLFQVDPM